MTLDLQLLTAADLAEIARTSVAAIHTARYRKQLPPAVKIGGRVLWRRSDVDEWLRAQLEDPRGS